MLYISPGLWVVLCQIVFCLMRVIPALFIPCLFLTCLRSLIPGLPTCLSSLTTNYRACLLVTDLACSRLSCCSLLPVNWPASAPNNDETAFPCSPSVLIMKWFYSIQLCCHVAARRVWTKVRCCEVRVWEWRVRNQPDKFISLRKRFHLYLGGYLVLLPFSTLCISFCQRKAIIAGHLLLISQIINYEWLCPFESANESPLVQ